MKHNFKTIRKQGPGRKSRKGQRKRVRYGATNPGGNGQGSVRRPY